MSVLLHVLDTVYSVTILLLERPDGNLLHIDKVLY